MSGMGHAELYVTWILLIVISALAAGTCMGVWRLYGAIQAFRHQLFGYRDNLE